MERMAQPGSAPPEERILEKYNQWKLSWLHDSLWFILLLVFAVLLFRYGIGLSVVGGDSMIPELEGGDVVLYTRIVKEYRPGDVISLRVPSGDYYVKRVVAVGGDVVELENGQVLVNGVMTDIGQEAGETLEENGAVIYPYKVREGNVFVLGDNRAVSMDSRAFGEVNLRQIKGKILLRAGKRGICFLSGSGTR